ncbi:long-chain fatty acid transporter-like protein [Stemphylium lycopersici]|nr:long-chain fatty acid transporter-like protein [Stemphylium lycopersici]
MALPIVAGAAGTAALAAYLNAKHHIAWDLKHARGAAAQSPEMLRIIADRIARKRLLTYHVFEEQVNKQPDHPFLIFEGKTWSYKEFFEAFTRVANWLIDELEVQVDEIVAIDGGNSPEYLMLWFALDAIGAVVSFVNWNVTGPGLVHCAKASFNLPKDKITLTNMANVEPSRAELEEIGVTIQYYNPSFFASLSNTTPVPSSRHENITMESVRSLIFTSGTTGLPKGVRISTAREFVLGRTIPNLLELKPETVMYTCMPVYHASAHALCTTPVIHAGSTLALGRKFSHKTFWPEVAASEASIVQYVGELCRYLLNGPKSPYEQSHKVRMAWGNGMRPDVWEPFRERFNIPIIHELYAATDGIGTSFNWNAGPFTTGCVGLRGLIWNWKFGTDEVRVKMDVDTEDIMRDKNGFAIRCGVNEPGQVLQRLTPETLASAPNYYGNEEATQGRRITNVFKKGDMWFKSGDMMRQDADGRVFFVDRLGDTFRWKSENVSTNEVADAIGKFPQVAETNVYGVLVPGYDGRAGTASIVMADGVMESTFDFAGLAKHARTLLPGYAVPLFLRVTPALEYTGTLKIQKGRLKKEGVDPDKITGDDKLYWLPLGSDRYVPFGKNDWQGVVDKSHKMGKAEAGSTKWVANKMKSKGLQRLRWWCEPCQKQCRDANGFKCHVQSESHVRNLQIVGEDPKKYINNFSNDFQRDFVNLLRTAHNEKWISANKFYNEYIRDKEHVHMNATKWSSLTEFTKHLGREGICHVKEDEKDGLMIAWRDTSAAAVTRRNEIAELEAAEARSGAGEDKMLKKMAKRAQEEAEAKKVIEAKRAAAQAAVQQQVTPPAEGASPTEDKKVDSQADEQKQGEEKKDGEDPKADDPKPDAAPVKLSFGLKAKAAPANKAGLGQMKSQSIFKRKKDDASDQKPVKKVKL